MARQHAGTALMGTRSPRIEPTHSFSLSYARLGSMTVGVWLLWGILWSAEVVVSSRQGPHPAPVGVLSALAQQVPLAMLWAILTPAIVWLGRACPPFGGRWWVGLPVHLLTSMVVVYATSVFYDLNLDLVRGPTPGDAPVLERAFEGFIFWALSDGLMYWSIVLVAWALRHYQMAREREVRALQLQTQLASAKLHALTMQLQPHFLYNALNTIGSLARNGENDLAVEVTAQLGDLLRRLLDGATTSEVELRDEIDFVRNYLDIEQVRFRDRLRVTIEVADEVLNAAVPPLILQPLVENALKHGVAPSATAGRVTISAGRVNGSLTLTVRDDGPGLGPDIRHGVGLSNTRQRLDQLYGRASEILLANAPAGGAIASIAIPFREWTEE